jgi:hypothetical protein
MMANLHVLTRLMRVMFEVVNIVRMRVSSEGEL